MTPGHRADGLDGRLRGVERRGLVRGQDQEVAARDRALDAERVLAQELAVHHGHPPVAPAVELLAGLVAVAEEAEVPADLDRLLAGREPVEAGGGGAGHHALADAVDQRLAERRGVEAEDQEAHAGPAVGRLGRRQVGLDARLGVAADHRRRVAGRQRGGRAGPRRPSPRSRSRGPRAS